MLIALDKEDCLLGFDVNSMETLSGTVRLVDTDDGIQWPVDGDLVRPKLVGNNWIEGATAEMISEHRNNQGIIIDDDPVNAKLDLILELLQKKEE
ncbi:hypothetical protein ACQ5RK_00405 [Latilactobacillus curvatus]